MAQDDAPLDIYVAAYGDATAAQQDWDGLKQLAKDKVISVDALVLVSRDDEGKIHIKDNAHDAGLGAAVGAVGGAIVGLIFPPALLASAAVGAGARRRRWVGRGPGAEASDQERPRRDPPARQLWDCCGVRGALGNRCGECAGEGGQNRTPPRPRDHLTLTNALGQAPVPDEALSRRS